MSENRIKIRAVVFELIANKKTDRRGGGLEERSIICSDIPGSCQN